MHKIHIFKENDYDTLQKQVNEWLRQMQEMRGFTVLETHYQAQLFNHDVSFYTVMIHYKN